MAPLANGRDVVAAARMYLANQADLYSVLGSDQVWDLWLFQESLYTRVESTQQTACVLKQVGSWTSPNEYSTARFPRLETEFYADPDRDVNSNNLSPLTAKDKILAAHEVIDKYLHNTELKSRFWPDENTAGAVRILRSTRQGELEWNPVSDGDGMMRASVFYAIGIG